MTRLVVGFTPVPVPTGVNTRDSYAQLKAATTRVQQPALDVLQGLREARIVDSYDQLILTNEVGVLVQGANEAAVRAALAGVRNVTSITETTGRVTRD